ncbi:IPT/TIG domain-containing protein [Streptomyces sp. DSM 44915]|uniref:IPT/TIG domain-containing protein n=1 Tax=Streptomyces chisholmiae TaxID=3075540 RepID=A0ABU2JL41_9ACTN|nr:IPT/TIG domain-containing protein [Streptomyces sp. DSM 44915]MDT0265234.1 IPT/TIG domain-containing protein [Streptomyces sp. DSM 44915]
MAEEPSSDAAPVAPHESKAPVAPEAAGAAPPPAHGTDCACGDCPASTRAALRRAETALAELRDTLAAGDGIPPALAHSPEAAGQWISDELTEAAREVEARTLACARFRLAALADRTLLVLWAGVALLLLGQVVTALFGAAGWTLARTTALLAAGVLAGLLTLAGRAHRERGGLLAPLIGEDNRLSTSRAVAVGWLALAGYAVLMLAGTLAGTGDRAAREALLDGLTPASSGGLLAAVAVACAVTVWVRHTVATRVRGFRMQKVRASAPHPADLLTDDGGRGSFADVQYLLVNAAALVLVGVRLARAPEAAPNLPWGVALLVVVSALTYLAAKYTEGARPVIQSVVRVREPGTVVAPIRQGDELEIRGSGFVPPGAESAHRLADTVVRIGGLTVPVPLVPTRGGYAAPNDARLVVRVPAEVEPGPVEVRVITAAGTESGRYRVTVAD